MPSSHAQRRSQHLLLATLLASQILPAQADEELFFEELPVVQSVSRLPQPLADAPGSVTVIDREMIRASGMRNLNDIFRLVPGFQTYVFNTDAPPRNRGEYWERPSTSTCSRGEKSSSERPW